MIISAPRLDLVEIDLDAHRALQDGRLRVIAGAAIPPDLADAVPSARRIVQLERDPGELPWLVRALILRDERRVVGAAGFHEPPVDGRAELGYQICSADRRRGYAREAVVALMQWAAPHVRVFRASISPENVASKALVASLGFARVGEQIDPEDGLEWIFERASPP